MALRNNMTKELIKRLEEKIQSLQNSVLKKESDPTDNDNIEEKIKPPKKKRRITYPEYTKCQKCGYSITNTDKIDNYRNACYVCRFGKCINKCSRCNYKCYEAFRFCCRCVKIKGHCLLCDKKGNIICYKCSKALTCKRCSKLILLKSCKYQYCEECYEALFGLPAPAY